MRNASIAILLTLLVGACNGPFGLMAGGPLDGTPAPAPTDWAFAGAAGTIQLETNPAEPYSVNLAYTVIDGALYLNAGDTHTRWAQNMDADPRVRLRLDDRIYDLRAERVSDTATIEAFSVAWTGQSFFRRDPRDLEQVWIYRLLPREASGSS